MKIAIAFFFLLAGCTVMAQGTGNIQQRIDQVRQQNKKMDSIQASLNSTMENLYRTEDSLRAANMKRNAERDGEMILRMYNERQAKQKRKMYIYFGVGIFFLAVMVFGWFRKRKVKG